MDNNAYNSGMNNAYNNFPPMMNDSRTYTSWQPSNITNEKIKKDGNITSNWEYRQFMIKNADNIIKLNQQKATEYSGINMNRNYSDNSLNNAPDKSVNDSNINTPFIYNSLADLRTPEGYIPSDLKNLYTSNVLLQSRMEIPVITQSEIIRMGMLRSN